MSHTTETTPAIIDSTDPRAVLRAWLGGTQDMGGWPNGDRAAFRVALDAEMSTIAGEPTAFEGEIEAV